MANNGSGPEANQRAQQGVSFMARLRARGVLRVASSYGVIAWLLLQIADVTFEPLGVPRWVLSALIVVAALGLPVAVLLAWFYEITPTGVAADTAVADTARPTVHGVRRYADYMIIAVLVVLVAVLLVRQPEFTGDSDVLEASLAVMPFTNIGGDQQNEYLSDGLAEELLDQMGRVPGLRVSARSSSFYFKGQNVDAITAAKKLAVAAVLEGSVRREGKQMRISVRLIDGANGFQIWSSSFDRGSEDLLSMQQEIAASVVEALMPRFATSGGTMPAAVTSDVTAHDLYLLGLYQQRLGSDEGDEKAIELYGKAIAADPNFALAHAALGSYLLDSWYGSGEQSERDEAERLIRRAVALDDGLSEAHEALGAFLRVTQQRGAEDELRRAVELNPNNASAVSRYAWHLAIAGNPRKAIEMLRRALSIDPALLVRYDDLATMAASMGLRDEAQAVVQKAFDFFGPTAQVHAFTAWVHMGYDGLPDEDLCVAHALKARQLDPGRSGVNGILALCLMRMGELVPARAFAEAAARFGNTVPLTAVLDKTGERVAAYEFARSVLRERPGDLLLSMIIAYQLQRMGRNEEALELYQSVNMPDVAMDEAFRRGSGVGGLIDMAAAYIDTGNREEGLRLANWQQQYYEQLRRNGGSDLSDEAAVMAVLGRKDEAFALLRTEATYKGIWWEGVLYDRPAYRNLLGDPRLQEIESISRAHWAEVRERLPKTLAQFGLTMNDLAAAADAVGAKTEP